MSHVADVDVKLLDLDDVEAAIKPYGGTLIRGKKTHRWYGRFENDWQDQRAAVNRRDPATFGKCDHAISFPGINYEIGLCRNADGSYTPVYDSYGNYSTHDGQKLEQLLGVGLTKLVDEYGCAVTLRMMAMEGFLAERVVDANGDILAVCTR